MKFYNSFVASIISLFATFSISNGRLCNKADVIFVIDASGSVNYANWLLSLKFVQSVVSNLTDQNSDMRYGFIRFENKAEEIFTFDTYKETPTILDAIGKIQYPYDKETNISGAIWKMKEMFGKKSRNGVAKVGIFVSDGESTIDGRYVAQYAHEARSSGITIIVIAVTGAWLQLDELKLIASVHGGKQLLHNITYYSELPTQLGEIVKDTCDAVVVVPPGIGREMCEKADVVFVIDASGSVNYNNWLLSLKFVQSVVSNLTDQNSDMRYGFIRFENKAEDIFTFDTYNNIPTMIDAIGRIQYPYDKETNISGAIWKMREMFKKGARKGVTKVGIIVSDGESTIDGQYVAQYAREARVEGITLIVIAVTGSWLQLDELKLIPSVHRGRQLLYNITYYSEIQIHLNEIVLDTCEAGEDKNPKSICDENKDVIFLVDVSVIRPDDLMRTKKFILDVSRSLNISTTRIGVISYSNYIYVNVPLKFYNYTVNFTNSVEAMQARYSQTSNLALALKMAGDFLDSDNRARIIIIITNRGSSDEKQAIEYSVMLRANLYTLIKVMVIGKWINRHEIFEVASYPAEKSIYFLNNYGELSSYAGVIQQSMCLGRLECEKKVCLNNGFCSFDYLTYYCNCLTGFAGLNCGLKCQMSDVIIAVDTTETFDANFISEHVLTFLRFLMHRSQGLSNFIRIMVLELREQQSRLINFNEGNAWDSIQNLKFTSFGGKRNLASIMESGIQIFENQGRKEANKIILIVSFGKSGNFLRDFEISVQLRNLGIYLLIVYIPPYENIEVVNEMKVLASDLNGENVFVVKNINSLNGDVLPKLTESFCNSKNECLSNLCKEGSTCVDQINGFKCICLENQSGELCDKKCSVKYDIVFLIERSSNMRPERFYASIEFIKLILKNLNIGDNGCKIAVVTFADNSIIEFNLNAYGKRENLLKALHFPKYTYGKTNIANSLLTITEKLFVPEMGDRPNAPNYIIALTTGSSEIDSLETLKHATVLKNKGVRLVAVKIGEGDTAMELKNMVSHPPEEHIFVSTSYRFLNEQLSNNIVNNILCPERNPCEGNKCQFGSTCVPQGKSYECKCLPDKTGQFCDKSCRGRVDVVLALDLSGSLADSFPDLLSFCRTLVNDLIFYPNTDQGIKLAFITYSDDSQVQFSFDRYYEKSSILNALTFQQHINGRTNTASAFKISLESLLTSSANRRNVPDHIIVLTDGNSNVNAHQTIPEAGKLKLYGAKLTVVAVEDFEGINLKEVNSIASNPLDLNRYILPMLNRKQEIINIAGKIASSICDTNV